jgi:hypothetical protein
MNPNSSIAPCDTDDDCTVDGERCGAISSTERACLLDPSHCILRCIDDLVCPDEMTCSSNSVCQYTP